MKSKSKTPSTNKNTILSEIKKTKQEHNNVSMSQLQQGKNHSRSVISGKKQRSQVKNHLEGTLKLLQGRLGLSVVNRQKKMTTLGMSQQIYRIVKEYIPEKQEQTNKNNKNSTKSQEPTMNSITNSTNDLHHKKRSQSNHQCNISTQNVMEYFKQKFGQPANNEEDLEKKIKLLQRLKRTQEIASRNSSNYNSSMHSAFDISGLGGKDVVIGKIKQKFKAR